MLVCLGLQGWKVNGETRKCRALRRALRRIVMLPGRMDTEFFSFLLDDDHVMRYMHFPPFFFVMGSWGAIGCRGNKPYTHCYIFDHWPVWVAVFCCGCLVWAGLVFLGVWVLLF